jgi:hypothetical protein
MIAKIPPHLKKGEQDLLTLLEEVNENLYEFSLNVLYQKWLPKKAVMRFFDYGETQMREVEKDHKLQVSRIKARKFYSVESILSMLNSHKIN